MHSEFLLQLLDGVRPSDQTRRLIIAPDEHLDRLLQLHRAREVGVSQDKPAHEAHAAVRLPLRALPNADNLSLRENGDFDGSFQIT